MRQRPLHRRLLGMVLRPEYVFRPSQVLRRLRRFGATGDIVVPLAWGLPIEVDATCYIGRDIVNVGLFERVIPEAIARLLDPGETAVDVGAHVGQNTSMMALAAGPRGRVIAVEAHPATSRRLAGNVARWHAAHLAPIDMHAAALGATAGTATLWEADGFADNSGRASLAEHPPGAVAHEVPVRTLDAVLGGVSVGVLKLDVEGFELQVLEGGRASIEAGAIRDIVFEDRLPRPSPVVSWLQAQGYVVFGLDRTFGGPSIVAPQPGRSALDADYLATRDPERALARYQARGWRCLSRPSTWRH